MQERRERKRQRRFSDIAAPFAVEFHSKKCLVVRCLRKDINEIGKQGDRENLSLSSQNAGERQAQAPAATVMATAAQAPRAPVAQQVIDHAEEPETEDGDDGPPSPPVVGP